MELSPNASFIRQSTFQSEGPCGLTYEDEQRFHAQNWLLDKKHIHVCLISERIMTESSAFSHIETTITVYFTCT